MNSETIKITFLVDNNPGEVCRGEHGLSIFIEADKKILFDAGQSSLFLENADLLGIDVSAVETVALSHGHYDHGDGLKYIAGKPLVCHPGCFTRRYREKNAGYIGLGFDQNFAEASFCVSLASSPLKLSESVIFLGEIPRQNDFEAKPTSFTNEGGLPDYVVDDSALVVMTPDGLLIIAGCAHSGICNIIDYSMRVTGVHKIAAVVGGFHLKENSTAIDQTLEYFKRADIGMLMPCHCVDESVINLFHHAFRCERVFSGKTKIF